MHFQVFGVSVRADDGPQNDGALVSGFAGFFSGQEFEQMERMAISDDGRQLLYEQELSSGGRTVRCEEAFPSDGGQG